MRDKNSLKRLGAWARVLLALGFAIAVGASSALAQAPPQISGTTAQVTTGVSGNTVVYTQTTPPVAPQRPKPVL